MKIVTVSDTNIFIDLIEIELIEEFFALPWEIHTTDLVIYELKEPRQSEIIAAYQKKKVLQVKRYEGNEMITLAAFHTATCKTAKISIEDSSILFYAQINCYTLLTGDAKLRKAAENAGLEVHGVLFVIGQLVEHKLLSKAQAVAKLNELRMKNPRLPQTEIKKLIRLWSETAL